MKELDIRFLKPISGVTFIRVNGIRSRVAIRKDSVNGGYTINWLGAVVDTCEHYRTAKQIAINTINKAY